MENGASRAVVEFPQRRHAGADGDDHESSAHDCEHGRERQAGVVLAGGERGGLGRRAQRCRGHPRWPRRDAPTPAHCQAERCSQACIAAPRRRLESAATGRYVEKAVKTWQPLFARLPWLSET